MIRRNSRVRAFAPDPDADGRPCEMPGCKALGQYRAPLSRTALNQYRWFCLEHVRVYNASWDFYKGMSPGQIEHHLRADISWQRPTWRMGSMGTRVNPQQFNSEMLRDPLNILGAAREAEMARRRSDIPPELRGPLAVLGLSWPITMLVLRDRYKNLAKQHHPDANHGDKAAEERIKGINIAYSAVRIRLQAEPKLAKSA
ncbi:MAG: J domain-containing protein [Acetobacteraceae bacterium]|nr:J domain-containing protein [Acetobacteraceae bacterium]